MSDWVALLLGLVAVGLLGRLGVEWGRYARGEHVISGRQLGLRVASGIVLVALLAMVAVGVRLEFGRVQSTAVYWGVSMLLAGAAMMLAVLDLFQVRRSARRRRAEIYRRISSYIRQVSERRSVQQAGDE